jgi:hypothetical protein
MREKPTAPNPAGRKGRPISGAPLSMDQLADCVFQIKPSDAKRIVASKPGKKKRND